MTTELSRTTSRRPPNPAPHPPHQRRPMSSPRGGGMGRRPRRTSCALGVGARADRSAVAPEPEEAEDLLDLCRVVAEAIQAVEDPPRSAVLGVLPGRGREGDAL